MTLKRTTAASWRRLPGWVPIIRACSPRPNISAHGQCPCAAWFVGSWYLFSGWGLEKVGMIKRGLGEHQAIATRDRAAYLNTLTVQQPQDILWQGPIRVVYFLFNWG